MKKTLMIIAVSALFSSAAFADYTGRMVVMCDDGSGNMPKIYVADAVAVVAEGTKLKLTVDPSREPSNKAKNRTISSTGCTISPQITYQRM